MTAKRFFLHTLLIVTLFFQNCTSDNKKTARQSSPVTAAEPASQEPTATVEPVVTESQEKKESPVGKSAEKLQENKTNRIGTIPTGKDAELNTTKPAPPTKFDSKPVKRSGPPGYITRKDAVLLTEPSPNAAKISALNQYEIIYIIETIMTDEQGRSSEYPTWYKVERENKQRGWVVAKSVNAGAGG